MWYYYCTNRQKKTEQHILRKMLFLNIIPQKESFFNAPLKQNLQPQKDLDVSPFRMNFSLR